MNKFLLLLLLSCALAILSGCKSAESMSQEIDGNDRLKSAIGKYVKSEIALELKKVKEELEYKSGDGFWKGAGKFLLYSGADDLLNDLNVEFVVYDTVKVDSRIIPILLSNFGKLPNAKMSGEVVLTNISNPVQFKSEITEYDTGVYHFVASAYYRDGEWHSMSTINYLLTY